MKYDYLPDKRLYGEIMGPQETLVLQSDINDFATWCDDWGLKISPQKCSTYTIYLKRSQV